MVIGCGILTAVILVLCELELMYIDWYFSDRNKAAGLDLCSGTNFLGPGNRTTVEGANHFPILCQLTPVQATPFWKINGTTYYYSGVPPPLVVSKSGREIYIPLVLLSLNGTSFQCFIPSSSEAGLFSSSIGVLTVIPNGTNPQKFNLR